MGLFEEMAIGSAFGFQQQIDPMMNAQNPMQYQLAAQIYQQQQRQADFINLAMKQAWCTQLQNALIRPERKKLNDAKAIADEVRSRHPEMQVKRKGNHGQGT